jgi:inhibitor of KinA
MIEHVPAYSTIAVYYDPLACRPATESGTPYTCVRDILQKLTPSPEELPPGKLLEVPTCYGGDLGPDLPFVARHCGLSVGEVVDVHTSRTYRVYMLGFSPGFPYLGGLSDRIAVPRRPSPRVSVPAGSVAIAGEQSGIYPIESPGGWQLIGRTPLRLFEPDREPPALLRMGDEVRFRSISQEEYRAMQEGDPGR